MFHLLLFLFCFPFYVMYWAIKVLFYAITVIVSFIINLIQISSQSNIREDIIKNNEKKTVKRTYGEIRDEGNSNIQSNKYIDLYDLNKKTKNKNDDVDNKNYKFELTELSDLECKITIEKIQELYKECGFQIKVVGVEKKKYLTEYELIFPNEISQYEILSISDKIIENFSIDGVRIIKANKNNRIVIQVPLKYEKHLH